LKEPHHLSDGALLRPELKVLRLFDSYAYLFLPMFKSGPAFPVTAP
jgi:hypothetical protein